MVASKKKSLKVAKTWGGLTSAMKPLVTKKGSNSGKLQAWHAKLKSCGKEFKDSSKSTVSPSVAKIAEKVVERVEAAIPPVIASKPKEKRRLGTTLIAPLPVAKAIEKEVRGPPAGVTHEELAKKRGLAFDKWEKMIVAREKDREERVRKLAKNVLSKLKSPGKIQQYLKKVRK